MASIRVSQSFFALVLAFEECLNFPQVRAVSPSQSRIVLVSINSLILAVSSSLVSGFLQADAPSCISAMTGAGRYQSADSTHATTFGFGLGFQSSDSTLLSRMNSLICEAAAPRRASSAIWRGPSCGQASGEEALFW